MLKKILQSLQKKYPYQKEFHQAVYEAITSLKPLLDSDKSYEKHAILERLIEPEREIFFRVCWLDDNNQIQVNRGCRVEFNSAIGPYKGGLRFHPSVNESVIKFLGFEQVLKNSLTTLAMGGAKGGAILTLKGRASMRSCVFAKRS